MIRRKLRLALVANTDYYLYHFRLALIKELVKRGVEVYVVAPPGEFAVYLERLGTIFVPWNLERSSFNPYREFRSLASLMGIYRRIKPTIAHHFTIKPNIYGPIAAKLSGVRFIVATITGLGFIFIGDKGRGKVMRPVISYLYRFAFRFSHAITIQNKDDQETLQRFNALPRSKVHYIPGGSGVDLSFFNPMAINRIGIHKLRKSLGINANSAVVLLIARMLWHKGIKEFVESAHLLKSRYEVNFLLVGPVDEGNLASIPLQRIREWEEEGRIQYLNKRNDIRDLLALSDIVVLPSYREGAPRVLMEAAAMGKAIVATDVPGCRDVVAHGENGLLVRSKDSLALAGGIEKLLLSEELRNRFGDAARQKAEREYDEGKIVTRFIGLYSPMLTERKVEGRDEFCRTEQ